MNKIIQIESPTTLDNLKKTLGEEDYDKFTKFLQNCMDPDTPVNKYVTEEEMKINNLKEEFGRLSNLLRDSLMCAEGICNKLLYD
jgi:hypothetical protein